MVMSSSIKWVKHKWLGIPENKPPEMMHRFYKRKRKKRILLALIVSVVIFVDT